MKNKQSIRLPYNVHVLLYRKYEDGHLFAIFRRSDLTNVWQGVCGGGESGESIEQTAIRECREEAGIETLARLFPLDCTSSMQADIFPEWTSVWGKDVLVLPMYHLAMEYDGPLRLSEEHLEYTWESFDAAIAKICFADQRLALWELHERIQRGNLSRPIPSFMKKVCIWDTNLSTDAQFRIAPSLFH